MSFWWYKKEADGKKSWNAIDIPFPLIVMTLLLIFVLYGIPSSRTYSEFVTNSFYAITVGIVLIFVSKVSLFKKGIWKSWGTSQMTKPFKMLYMIGYILMTIGVIRIITAFFYRI